MHTAGRWILGGVAAMTATNGYLIDWNRTHLFNPNWPPHATFRNARTMLLGASLGTSALYSLRKGNTEMAALLPAMFWASQAGSSVFPNTGGLESEFSDRVPKVRGVRMNEATFSAAMLALTAIGYGLARQRADASAHEPGGIPRETNLDSTLALLSEGYTFISRRSRRFGSDLFETRLMLRKAVCMTGAEAAETFYQPDRFTRQRALPPTTLMLLQDTGSVQLLDGDAHRHRKQMFMSLMSRESISRLTELVEARWRARIPIWESRDEVVLHDEAREILCSAVLEWAGIPLAEHEVEQRTREFGAMIDGAGAVGPRNWRGMLLRTRTERWAKDIIERVRSGALDVPEGSAAHAIAWHGELDGELLDRDDAAVELINVLRPTVAVARYIAFAALALHEHPWSRERLQTGDDDDLEAFAQEVRRFYPFFPFVGGRARYPFDWRGHHFDEGSWVLLDLYGTNHDSRIWPRPDDFRPERFLGWDGNAYTFIPQGGGDYFTGHRCPGEWIAIELTKTATRLLTTEMHYDMPTQDLSIDLSRMPAIPKSHVVIANVRRRLQEHVARAQPAPGL